MRTTAIINLKGGVAKTTTALNMAAILAKDYKQRVLLVDADSQCNCTEFFQRDAVHPGTLADMLRGLAPCIEHSRFDHNAAVVLRHAGCESEAALFGLLQL